MTTTHAQKMSILLVLQHRLYSMENYVMCVLLKSVEMFFVILLFSNVIPQMK